MGMDIDEVGFRTGGGTFLDCLVQYDIAGEHNRDAGGHRLRRDRRKEDHSAQQQYSHA